MLSPDQRSCDSLCCLVVILVSCRMIGIEKQMAHCRCARRLNPDHRIARFHLTPTAREVRKVRPHVPAVSTEFFHCCRRALHRVEDLLAVWRGRRLTEKEPEERE